MNTIERFRDGDVEYRRVAASTWSYLPIAASPQRGPDGTPMVSVLRAGDLAMVQFTVQLDPPASATEAARERIAALPGTVPPVVLAPAVQAVELVELVVDPRAEARVVATSTGSGYPPFTAVFSLQPTGADLAALETAFAGVRAQAEVRHHIVTGAGRTVIATDLAGWTGAAAPASASSIVVGSTDPSTQQEGTTC